MDWVKKNLKLPEVVSFINWNTYTESPIDMFLMSQCKYAIIANSTFSYWGAYLGVKKCMVFYPKKWNNGVATPEIFEKDWIHY